MREKIAQRLIKFKFFVSDHTLYLSIGLFSVLLGGLFVTVFQVQKQQETRSLAQAGLIPHENCSASKEQVNLDSAERKLFSLVNQYRKDNGLSALIDDEPLNRGAAWLAKDMADSNKFSHTDSLGRNPGERIVDCGFYGEENQVRENIAKGQTTPEDVFNGWKKSKVHNETMLDPEMVYGGVGRRDFKSSSNKPKNCKGKKCDVTFKTYYWVMNFTGQPDVDSEDSDDEECYYYEDAAESASTGDALIAANNKNNNNNNNNKKNNNGGNKNNNGGGNGGGGSNKNDKKDNNGAKNDKKNNGGKNDKNNKGGKGNNNGGNKKNGNNNDEKKKKKKKKKNKDNNTNTDEEEIGEELEEGDEDLPPCDEVEEAEEGVDDSENSNEDEEGVDEEVEEQPQVTEPTVPSLQFAVNVPGAIDLGDVRELTVDFTDLNNQVVATNKVPIQGFSDDMYIGFLEYGTLPSGVYKIRTKLPNSLRQTIEPQYQRIDVTQDIDLPEVTLVMGDFDNNNILNILDFNIFKNCMDIALFEEEEDEAFEEFDDSFEEETFEEEEFEDGATDEEFGEEAFDEEFDEDAASFSRSFRILNTTCSQHDETDLNGDGVVNLLDYNLLLNSFQTLKSN